MARLRAEVKNLRVPGTPDPNAENIQALSLAVEQLPSVEVLLARWSRCRRAVSRPLRGCPDGGADSPAGRSAVWCGGAYLLRRCAFQRCRALPDRRGRRAAAAGLRQQSCCRDAADRHFRRCPCPPYRQAPAYRQMLARALAACGSVPVAELSATFEGLTARRSSGKECGEKPFPLSEPLSACRRAYRQLRRALDAEAGERYFARRETDGRKEAAAGCAPRLHLRGSGRGPLAGKPAPGAARKRMAASLPAASGWTRSA